MEQFVPDVSESDVERIIKRDLPVEEHDGILEIIRQLEVREKARVVLACLKNSGGDLRKLKYDLAEASGYYREHIGEAEYPNYMKKIFRIDKLSEAEISTIFEKDKNQYLAWLRREKEVLDR
ncbi:MAG TPA: hypothetical protein VKB81_15005 [Nitrospira sp.]|nr:hypothetical protein [Nitrospira sp.]